MSLQIIPVSILEDISFGDDLVDVLLKTKVGRSIKDGDILIFTQKIISKQEGRKINLSEINPSLLAIGIAGAYEKDPRIVQLILDETKRIVRMKNGIIISQTPQGLVCANAGVDESNVEKGFATLLPKDSDKSAQKIRRKIKAKTGKDIAVLISDTFGRPFREGQTDVAIGMSGISPIVDYKGKHDTFKRILRVTEIAIADEICSASELVRGKMSGTPIAIVRNYNFDKKNGSLDDLLRNKSLDLFR
ncbi:Coenzyme F420:L-glutamate ligase [Nitrosotalea sinensis]|jgi:coenzyme F420-0:L-glutamate ligase/coenzyme F420-1:gamma-L-glutamate ligase|uniref:Coenzyme F420:L-glutamate ligase n=1 Tax=Nitrosotalea sinensis TaxID=1499975 RepID=A0A2H1EJE6_9ARCH|nr:coenzyme F420-0:L-glutamate ligase [Candidatus Nitrosotalea sinensis]SHO47408.1 Coenzyme F420:L-glutamate ligase [Candidatus Nitrosotalea sinensis]